MYLARPTEDLGIDSILVKNNLSAKLNYTSHKLNYIYLYYKTSCSNIATCDKLNTYIPSYHKMAVN